MSGFPSKKTTLYALGSNGRGQLGLPHKNDISRPEKCQFYSLSTDERPNGLFTPIDHIPLYGDESITKLVAGGNHTILLTSHGRAFAAGDLSFHFGFSGGEEMGPEPEPESKSESRDTGLGFREVHLDLFLQASGHIKGFGGVIITDVAATWSASFFVVNKQRIYVTGHGDKGELGRGEQVREFLGTEPPVAQILDVHEFEPEAEYVRIERISACMNHVVVLTTTGNLYGWGASRKGQLGAGLQGEKILWRPKRVVLKGLEGAVRHVVTGREFTFVVGKRWENHVVLGAAPRGGFGFPMRLGGEFSNSEGTSMDPSLYVDMSNIEVHALWSGVIVKLPNGQIHGFGRNDEGQLIDAHGTEMFKKVAAGSEHSVALLVDGTVRAWGWGEHGNCGDGDMRKSDGSEDRSPLFRPKDGQSVAGVGAGCATTFFWVEEIA